MDDDSNNYLKLKISFNLNYNVHGSRKNFIPTILFYTHTLLYN